MANRPVYETMSINWLLRFWRAQAEWSQKTFGPDSLRGPTGPARHLAREILTEILMIPREDVDAILAKSPKPIPRPELVEYVDVQFLLVDSCRRAGYKVEEFTKGLFDKLEENKQRTWPPFDPNNIEEAVEHKR